MKVFNINDSYFKYQKCLSGITYQFVNQLDNIYEKNLMVGTNYCIYCMYNEFDIINNFMINLYQVDVASTTNLDLTKRYSQLDGVNLKSGHRVILVGQDNKIENDIYKVDSRGYLIITDELAETGRTWRYKAYVKLGGNKGKQFHLINTGNRFPLKGEKKDFLDGHGYIIKSLFNYDMFDTGPMVPKLVFTDYELARITLNQNYQLYNGFNFFTGNTVEIKYHDNSYLILVDDDGSKYSYTGTTLAYYDLSGHTIGGTIYNRSGITYGNETYVETDANFCTNADVYDYIKLEISGATNLYLKTFVKRIESPDIVLSDYIPDNILNDYYTGATPSIYTLTNLMYSSSTGVTNTMLESFYAKYFDINSSNNLYPIENTDNVYFDYDGLYFNVTGDTYYTSGFTTDNYYIKYKLYDHLNRINSYLFNSSYYFLIYPYTLNSFLSEYFDARPNPYIYPATLSDIKGTLIKITPYTPSLVNYFRNHTYVRVSDGAHNYKTLIVDLVPNSHFVIETPRANPNMTITEISVIYNLKEISDLLYDVYVNDLISGTTDDYYRLRDDDMRRNICNGYANFISEDIGIIDNVTAFLMQDAQHKFILKVYDPENAFNGGITRLPYVVTRQADLSKIGSSAAILEGEVMSDGGAPITERGICYYKPGEPMTCVMSPFNIGEGLGVFESSISGLTPDTFYYFKAYAQNNTGLGRAYGDPCGFTTGPPSYAPPTVSTNQNNAAYSHYLTLGGNVIDKNYTDILVRGVVVQSGSTTPNTGDTLTVYLPESGNVGAFTLDVTGLTHDKLYSYAAFAINICGTTYGNTYEVSTLYPAPPIVIIDGVDNITYNSFDILLNLVSNDNLTDGSNLTDPVHGVREMGIVYSNDPYNVPTTGNTIQPYTSPYAIGPFTVNVTGLTENIQFYVRGYAQNSLYTGSTWSLNGDDTTSYSTQLKSLSTSPLPVAPTIIIDSLSHVTTTADIHTHIVSNGGDTILEKGLYWSTGSTVDIYCNFESATGTTDWYANLTGLTATTEYAVMSMAANAFATGYTSTSGFTTLPVQTVPTGVTLVVSPVTPTGATATGDVIFDGYSYITQKAIQYSGSTTGGWINWTDGTGTGPWISNITGLTAITTYWARSYATNSIGTTYNSDPTEQGTAIMFTTPSGHIPPVFDAFSPVISSIGLTTAIATSTIINDGGDAVIQRGILYSGTTIGGWLNWVDPGVGIGTYGIVITGLTSGSTYYVRSYAINSEGTGYSNNTAYFNTLSIVSPTIQLDKITNITPNEANLNSTVTNNGGSSITSEGGWTDDGATQNYWSYSPPYPPVTGSFAVTATGLTQLTNYTGKSYAINIAGTSWSNELYFRTLAINDVNVNLEILTSGVATYVYQVGDTKNLLADVSITTNNLTPSELYNGDLVFWPTIAPSATTIGTWGSGITSASFPYNYSPLLRETKYFTATENCGTPPTLKYTTKQIDAIYPYLTCARVPYPTPPGGPIPSPQVMAQLCSSGSFYTGNFAPNNEPMLKKIELATSQKIYYYNISGFPTINNLIYIAHPIGAEYGTLQSVLVQQISSGNIFYPSFTTYASMNMASSGLPNNWQVLYNVYAFQVLQGLGPIWVTYIFSI
jgi:hypothetical protein